MRSHVQFHSAKHYVIRSDSIFRNGKAPISTCGHHKLIIVKKIHLNILLDQFIKTAVLNLIDLFVKFKLWLCRF